MLLLWSPWLPNPSSSPRIDSVMDINSKASLKGNCVHKTLKDKRLYCKKQIWSGEIEMHMVIANCNEDPMWSYDLLRLSRLNCLPYRSQNITWRPPDTVLPWLLYKLTRIPWLEISFGTNNWLYGPFKGLRNNKKPFSNQSLTAALTSSSTSSTSASPGKTSAWWQLSTAKPGAAFEGRKLSATHAFSLANLNSWKSSWYGCWPCYLLKKTHKTPKTTKHVEELLVRTTGSLLVMSWRSHEEIFHFLKKQDCKSKAF